MIIAAILLGSFLRVWQLVAVPPGLHYDLAANALLTNDIAFGGWRPVFITGFTGKEVLFFYSAALFFRLLGPSVFALRLTAALWGILAIPTTFFALCELGRHMRHSRWMAAFGAVLLATLFMHVVWSRFGFRVITEPVIQALALGFLFRGLRRRQWWALALGGGFSGLAAYTYLAARLFPIPLAVALLVLLLATLARRAPAVEDNLSPAVEDNLPLYNAPTNPQYATRSTLLQLAVYLFAAAVVFAPLGRFFVQNPDTFFTRIAQVAPREGENDLVRRGITGSLGMLFVSGEPYDRFNIPGRPIFDALQAGLFIVGLGVTLWRFPWPKQPVDWAAETLLVVWVPVMLLPTALAVHEIFPSNVRAFGLLPVVVMFPARGAVALVEWLSGVAARARYIHRWYTIGAVVVLAAGVLISGYDYFARWGRQEILPGANDADLVNASAFLETQDLTNTTVYMSAIHYRHPTLAFLSPQYNAIKWNTGGASLVVPAEGAALYIFPQSGALPAEWLAGWGAALVASQPGGGGFNAYRFEAGAQVPLPATMPLDINFSNLLVLEGASAQPAADYSTVTLDLRWQVLNLPVEGDFQPYVRLVDAWGYTWAQAEQFSYPSEQWTAGDTMLTRLLLDMPPGMPPGDYDLRVGMFAPSTATNLSVTDASGRYAGQRATATTLTLGAPPNGALADFMAGRTLETPQPSIEIGGLQLLGYTLARRAVRQGESLDLTLYWYTSGSLPDLPELDITLGAVAWREHPVHDTFPFGRWQPGQVVIDRHTLRVPPDAAPGGAPLTLAVGDISAELGRVNVQTVAREFAAPAAMTPIDGVIFGESIALVGYTIVPGGETAIELVWQSLAPVEQNYTVFVHVLTRGGALVDQRDIWPQNGGYGTMLWATGEYIRDIHSFNLPAGDYQLAIGLYLPETGEHLLLSNGSDRATLSNIVVSP